MENLAHLLIAVLHIIDVQLGKETVTLILIVQEILFVEKIIVYLSLGMAVKTLIVVKRVRHCELIAFDMISYAIHTATF